MEKWAANASPEPEYGQESTIPTDTLQEPPIDDSSREGTPGGPETLLGFRNPFAAPPSSPLSMPAASEGVNTVQGGSVDELDRALGKLDSLHGGEQQPVVPEKCHTSGSAFRPAMAEPQPTDVCSNCAALAKQFESVVDQLSAVLDSDDAGCGNHAQAENASSAEALQEKCSRLEEDMKRVARLLKESFSESQLHQLVVTPVQSQLDAPANNSSTTLHSSAMFAKEVERLTFHLKEQLRLEEAKNSSLVAKIARLEQQHPPKTEQIEEDIVADSAFKGWNPAMRIPSRSVRPSSRLSAVMLNPRSVSIAEGFGQSTERSSSISTMSNRRPSSRWKTASLSRSASIAWSMHKDNKKPPSISQEDDVINIRTKVITS